VGSGKCLLALVGRHPPITPDRRISGRFSLPESGTRLPEPQWKSTYRDFTSKRADHCAQIGRDDPCRCVVRKGDRPRTAPRPADSIRSPNRIRTRASTLREAPRTSRRPATIRKSPDRRRFLSLAVSCPIASFVTRWGTEGARPSGLEHPGMRGASTATLAQRTCHRGLLNPGLQPGHPPPFPGRSE
jgi:hypothetical protein